MSAPGRVASASHARCFACGPANPRGLGLRFTELGKGRVIAEAVLGEDFQGYEGVLQGGVVAAALDCAMVHCLFSLGIEAYTARLQVKFGRPTAVGAPFTVEARLVSEEAERLEGARILDLRATLRQEGAARASATARFVERR